MAASLALWLGAGARVASGWVGAEAGDLEASARGARGAARTSMRRRPRRSHSLTDAHHAPACVRRSSCTSGAARIARRSRV